MGIDNMIVEIFGLAEVDINIGKVSWFYNDRMLNKKIKFNDVDEIIMACGRAMYDSLGHHFDGIAGSPLEVLKHLVFSM